MKKRHIKRESREIIRAIRQNKQAIRDHAMIAGLLIILLAVLGAAGASEMEACRVASICSY